MSLFPEIDNEIAEIKKKEKAEFEKYLTECEPYRPSNGTEGMLFESEFCNICKHDEDSEGTDWTGCKILASAICGEQPKEWVRHPEKGINCIKFETRRIGR